MPMHKVAMIDSLLPNDYFCIEIPNIYFAHRIYPVKKIVVVSYCRYVVVSSLVYLLHPHLIMSLTMPIAALESLL